MSGYILGRDAARDLEDLWDYIAGDNIDAADHVIADLFEAFQSLSQFPEMGHPRQDLTKLPVRFWPWAAISSSTASNRALLKLLPSRAAIETSLYF